MVELKSSCHFGVARFFLFFINLFFKIEILSIGPSDNLVQVQIKKQRV